MDRAALIHNTIQNSQSPSLLLSSTLLSLWPWSIYDIQDARLRSDSHIRKGENAIKVISHLGYCHMSGWLFVSCNSAIHGIMQMSIRATERGLRISLPRFAQISSKFWINTFHYLWQVQGLLPWDVSQSSSHQSTIVDYLLEYQICFYLAEYVTGDKRKYSADKSLDAYKAAFDIACTEL